MELKIEDLMTKCEECGGTGRQAKPDGGNVVRDDAKKCRECGGRGFVLTNSGQALLKFFQRVKLFDEEQ